LQRSVANILINDIDPERFLRSYSKTNDPIVKSHVSECSNNEFIFSLSIYACACLSFLMDYLFHCLLHIYISGSFLLLIRADPRNFCVLSCPTYFSYCAIEKENVCRSGVFNLDPSLHDLIFFI